MRYLLPLLLLLTGCIVQNMTAEEHLRDAVDALNEGLRWSRMDVVMPRVSPDYRQRFAEAHRTWGQSVRIADAELLGVRVGESRDHAISTVAFRWYSYDTMTIHQAVILQSWKRTQGGYYLVEERVVQGDPEVLAPAPDDDAAKGGDPMQLGASPGTAQAG